MERHRRALLVGIYGAVLTLTPMAAHAQPAQLSSNAGPKPIAKVEANEDRTAVDWRVLTNTGVLAAGVALLAVPIGTLLALCLIRTDVPGRRVAMAAIVFLLFLPLYVQVGGWEAAFGKLGWFTNLREQWVLREHTPSDPSDQSWPKPFLSGMRAVIFLHAMAAVPWVVVIVSAGLRLVRREEEEIALLDASGPQVMARVVLPQIAPFALAAGLLAAVSAAGEMTVTNIYLVDPGDYTLAEQVYMTLQSEPLATAVRQSAPSIVATVLLVAIGWWTVSRLVTPDRTLGNPQRPLVYSLGNWKWPATLLVWMPLAAAIGLPIVSLAYKAGTLVIWDADVPTRAWSAFKSVTMPWTGLWSVRGDVGWTITFAAAAATLDVVVAIGVTYFVRAPVLKNAVAVGLAAVAFALPGPVVGLIIIGLMDHNLAGIGWLYDRTDLPTILAQSVRALPIVMLMVLALLSRFPAATLDAAKLDGAGAWSILMRIVIPQRAKALLAAWLGGFAIAAGDLAWSILVLRPGVDTLQRRLFGDIHAGADDRVAAICLAIGILYGGGAAAILWLQRVRR